MKKLLRFALAVAALLVAVSVCYEVRGAYIRSQFHGERFNEIKPGMTQTEVEALLGAPPGNYASRGYGTMAYGIVLPGVRREVWIDDDHMYEISFTSDDKVAGTHVRENIVNAGGFR